MQKERLSNMELLRVVSMLFVLILHANFLGIHAPSPIDLKDMPVSTFFRCYTEALTIVAVNVFVLISGWFGIHFSFKKLGSLCFQVLFFTIGFFLFFLLINPSQTLTVEKIKGIFLLNGDYWFVKAYIILYLISPVLNAFVEHATKKQFIWFLVSYYAFHTLYGWLMDSSVSFTMNGTTGLSFIGLYMLGRFLRLYPLRITQLKRCYDFVIYLGAALLLCICNIVLLHLGQNVSVEGRLYSYASPIVILSSIYLLLFFSKLSFTSKIVNWIAASCFAVYLFQCNGFFFGDYYRKLIGEIYKSSYSLIGVIFYVVLIYTISILLDKVRLFIWNIIQNRLK